MTDEQARDEEVGTHRGELLDAGHVEEYTVKDGQVAMRRVDTRPPV